jgi:hypothetical protein
MEKTQADHEVLILKANSFQDRVFNGVKKWESLEFQFDALNAH